MKKSFWLAASVVWLVIGSSGFALSYVDVQHPNQYIPSFGTYNGQFNIVSPGSSTFTISGFSSGNGTFSDAGGYVVGTPLSNVKATFYLTDTSFLHLDIVDISLGDYNGVDDAIWLLGKTTTFSFDGQSAQVKWLMNHGTIGYQVSSDFGDFVLSYAMLTASSAPVVPQGGAVADGASTLALVGMGLLGLVGVQRRLLRSV